MLERACSVWALLALDGTACGWTKIFRNRNLSCDGEKMQGSGGITWLAASLSMHVRDV